MSSGWTRRCVAMVLGTVGTTVLVVATSSMNVASATQTSPVTPYLVIDGCTIVANPTAQHHTVCPGANLAYAALTGLDLAHANLTRATLFKRDCSRGPNWGTPTSPTPISSAQISRAPISRGGRFNGAYLADVDLAGTNLTTANLTDTNLARADVSAATFTSATLTGASSGSVFGTPVSLPTNWLLIVGYLVGPDANLAYANFFGAYLDGASLAGPTLAAPTSRAPSLITPTSPVPT